MSIHQVKDNAVNLHFIAKREKNVVSLIDRSLLVRKSSPSVLRHLPERSQNNITHVATRKSMLTGCFFFGQITKGSQNNVTHVATTHAQTDIRRCTVATLQRRL